MRLSGREASIGSFKPRTFMLVATVQTPVCCRCKWLDLLKVTEYSSDK